MSKKKKKRNRIKNVSLFILEQAVLLLDDVVDITECCIDRKKLYRSVYGNMSTKTDYTLSKFANHLSNLRKGGYVNDVSINESKNESKEERNLNKSIELTNKAKLKVIELIAKKTKRDKVYRFVSFDIPEEKRKSRDQFRRVIKRMGFVQIQKSLWVTNKNLSTLVEAAAYEYGVEKYIAYIVSMKSDIDGIIEKKLSNRLKT